MKKGRILVVDNDVDVREIWKKRLEVEGYLVFTAASPNEAKELMQTNRVHLAIIDLKLIDHSDLNDISGIELAKELDPLIVKIILTGYPNMETMKRALGPRLDGKVLAFNYIAKDGPSELLQAIKLAFDTQIKINFDLEVKLTEKRPSGTLTYLEGGKVFKYLMDEVRDKSVGDSQKKEVSEELSEVFAKLFYSLDKITISPISTKRGYSGTGVVLVEPSSKEEGTVASVIVKFGKRKVIALEAENYDKYVKPFLRLRATEVGNPVYTKNFGGMIYSLVGTNIADIRDFRDYYNEDEKLITTSLRYLFKETCQLWYENKGKAQNLNLAELYRGQLGLFPHKKLEKALRDVFPEYDKKFTIEFPGLGESFINPVVWLKHREFPLRSYLSITHGDLNGKNILVDENSHPWLIDFFRTGPGHVLRDFVELEAEIKFDYLETSNIEALYEFESSLVSPKKFDDSCEFKNKKSIDELGKAINVIRELRTLAHSIVEPRNDMREYYIGLLYHTINIVRYPNIRKERKRHALLSASLLSQKLERWK